VAKPESPQEREALADLQAQTRPDRIPPKLEQPIMAIASPEEFHQQLFTSPTHPIVVPFPRILEIERSRRKGLLSASLWRKQALRMIYGPQRHGLGNHRLP
jgi:hypothetical protein